MEIANHRCCWFYFWPFLFSMHADDMKTIYFLPLLRHTLTHMSFRHINSKDLYDGLLIDSFDDEQLSWQIYIYLLELYTNTKPIKINAETTILIIKHRTNMHYIPVYGSAFYWNSCLFMLIVFCCLFLFCSLSFIDSNKLAENVELQINNSIKPRKRQKKTATTMKMNKMNPKPTQ